MPHGNETRRRSWKERALCMLLSAVLLIGLVPGLTLPVHAEHWADEYLDQMVDWGVMRADQVGDPDDPITRADFVAIINRAYGYTQTGPMPFTDVQPSDWYYDDISIAYTAGYIAGTSPTTAEPNATLTREMATCILARNMMMEDTEAESLAFSDSRDVSDWARGLVKTAVDSYVISGYPDNSFAPQNPVTKGEMAVLISRCVGNPLNEPGDYTLGDVFDNVTITGSGVTLRDTTISGDLYVSAGVGLGNVKLENVKVLGRVIVSGTGQSEKGDASVVMRNLTAEEMLVDNMRDQYVTVRAEGLTQINKTVVRTPAYLEDNTPDENGLRLINLEGAGAQLDLAGRIKEVVALAPRAAVNVVKGTVQKLTLDEKSTNSNIQLDRNTEVKELNLDIAGVINGLGDVEKMNVNSAGVTSSVLPDNIYIRPGLTGNIAGEDMDSAAAEEASTDPKILSGYPLASDVAPTSLRADFSTNKKGTVYWAVSSITDGSISADNLISPPSYGSVAEKNGSVAVPSANTVVNAPITGLTVGGSYYLSAVLVDARGQRSPVKVVSFTTPDNTKPAFASGYPYMSLIADTYAQAVVMATKSCKLYYAVLPKGAQAPTVNDLRSASVTGNLGYGVLDVVKNTELTFTVSRQLEELKDYVIYFWLSDADGVNSSSISNLSFTTKDTTPPRFNPEAGLSGDPGATNVPLIVGLDEPGTIYWVVVPRGTAYPKPNNQNPDDNVTDAAGVQTADLTREYAKLQVKNGRNATRSGSVRIANANTDTAMNITGLARETAYDLYYVAQDAAGNFSAEVKKLSINTLDETPPTVKQYFNRYTGKDNTRDPLVITDIMLEFSEDIRSSTGAGGGKSILDIWAEVSSSNESVSNDGKAALTNLLESSIELYQTSTSNVPVKVPTWNKVGSEPGSAWIDFSRATVSTKDGHVIVTLPYNEIPSYSAHRLGSGSTYYFQIKNITDNSDRQNELSPNPVNYENMGTDHNIPTFTTVFAQVHLSIPTLAADRPIIRNTSPDNNGVDITTANPKGEAVIDYTFRMIPDATETVDAGNSYDLQLYTGSNLAFDLYCRIAQKDSNGNPSGGYITSVDTAKDAGITPIDGGADTNSWFYLGNSGPIAQKTGVSDPGLRGVSVNGNATMANLLNFPAVNKLSQNYVYDFVITVTQQGGVSERGVWTGDVNFEVHVLAGAPNILNNLASDAYGKRRDDLTALPLTNGGLASIGQTTSGEKFLLLEKTFIDTRVPKFDQDFPKIDAGDSFADIGVSLDRAGTVYYVAAPLGEITVRGNLTELDSAGRPTTNVTSETNDGLWGKLPDQGQNKLADGVVNEIYQYVVPDGETDAGTVYDISITSPNAQQIMAQTAYNAYEHDIKEYGGGGARLDIPLRGLKPQTKYIVYFVLKGVSDEPSQVFAYRFETTESSKPRIALTDGNGTVEIDTSYGGSNSTLSVPSDLSWLVLTSDRGQKALEDRIGESVEIDTSDGITGYSDMTVLKALTTSYDAGKAYGTVPNNAKYGADKNGYSIFDLFATDEQKRALDSFVRTPGSVEGRISFGTTVTTAAQLYKNAAEWLASATNKNPDASSSFLFLVVGHNSASTVTGTDWSPVDSFRALDGVKVMDENPPKLLEDNRGTVAGTGVVGSIAYDPDSGTFSGYIRLIFDKDLYWRATDSASDTLYPVDCSGTGTDIKSLTDGAMTSPANIINGGTVNNGITVSGSGSSFLIDLNKLQEPDVYVMFLPTGYINSARGYSTSNKLEISISSTTPSQSGLTNYIPYFTVSFGSQTATISGASYSDKMGTDNTGGTGGGH